MGRVPSFFGVIEALRSVRGCEAFRKVVESDDVTTYARRNVVERCADRLNR